MRYVGILLLISGSSSLFGAVLTGSANFNVNPVGGHPGCASSFAVSGPANAGANCPAGAGVSGFPGQWSFIASSSVTGMDASVSLQSAVDNAVAIGSGNYNFTISQQYIVLGGSGAGQLTGTYQPDIVYQDISISGFTLTPPPTASQSGFVQFTYGVPFTITLSGSGSVGSPQPTRTPQVRLTFGQVFTDTGAGGLVLNPNGVVVTSLPAVPEPASLALLGIGLSAVCWLKGRRRSA